MRTNLVVEEKVNGTDYRGTVVVLHPGELHIRLTEPVEGISGSVHRFFGKNETESFQEASGLSSSGKEQAGLLIRKLAGEIQAFQKKKDSIHTIYRNVEKRLEAAYAKLKETRPESDQSSESMKEHRKVLQEILWLNNEYYNKVLVDHPELRGIGMDTLLDLTSHFF